MTPPTSDIAFTPAVKALQERNGSRAGYARMAEKKDWHDTVTPDLAAFLAERDSFYLGTASAAGRPYIQHRGGPRGVLKVLDSKTLAFADYSGNRQYITLGNLAENDQAYLFLMDYEHQVRIKIWGRAGVVEDDEALLAAVVDPDYDARAERVIRFQLEAWDKNCRQHIPHLVPAEEVDALRVRVAELEGELEVRRAS